MQSIQCKKSIAEMSDLYIDGNGRLDLKRHYVPVYSTQSSRKKRYKAAPKIINRLSNTEVKLPFLLLFFQPLAFCRKSADCY